MAEKIEMFAGWDCDGSAIVGRERNIHINQECTVVVHDGKAERVFTESEVKAMLRSITHCTGSPLASIHIEEVRRVFADEHGIVLDPA